MFKSQFSYQQDENSNDGDFDDSHDSYDEVDYEETSDDSYDDEDSDDSYDEDYDDSDSDSEDSYAYH